MLFLLLFVGGLGSGVAKTKNQKKKIEILETTIPKKGLVKREGPKIFESQKHDLA